MLSYDNLSEESGKNNLKNLRGFNIESKPIESNFEPIFHLLPVVRLN